MVQQQDLEAWFQDFPSIFPTFLDFSIQEAFEGIRIMLYGSPIAIKMPLWFIFKFDFSYFHTFVSNLMQINFLNNKVSSRACSFGDICKNVRKGTPIMDNNDTFPGIQDIVKKMSIVELSDIFTHFPISVGLVMS